MIQKKKKKKEVVETLDPAHICFKDLPLRPQADTKERPGEMGPDTRTSCLTDNAPRSLSAALR